jgi:hypothetical protein
MAYGALSHNPWGVPKPECPNCKTNVNVQAKIRNKNKGKKVSWTCVCGMVSEGCSEMPSCARRVPANWLNDFYLVDYPLPENIYHVTWREKCVGKRA